MTAATLVGSYDNCTLTPNVTITAPIMTMYNTPIPGGSAKITGSGSSLTAVLTGDGGINCTLMITATGTSATVPMQQCDTTIMGIPVVITFTSGTVTLGAGDGGELLNAMASVTVSGADGGIAVAGTGTLDAICTKM